MPLPAGMRLGPYEIQAPAGAGGMGEVYKAIDTRLDRTVAIKVLPRDLAANPDSRQRLEREARSVSKLSHPHICTLHDIGHQDDVDFLVMEYLEGETLEQRLLRGPLPTEQLLQYSVQIAGALEKAHRQGIIHRDFKPSNIMVTKSGTKLLDFGLAKLKPEAVPVAAVLTEMTAQTLKLTAEGTLVGTFQYMAPEQLEGREADARTDIFALGAVLYEMVTGKPAFVGKSRASLIAAILTNDPPPLTQLQPMTPTTLERVVRKCLAKDPDDRWQSASDLASELDWIARAGSQAGVTAPMRISRLRRERMWMGAAALLALATAVLAVFFYRAVNWKDEALHASIQAPAEMRFVFTSDVGGPPVLSPDGRALVYVAIDKAGTRLLWLQRLDTDTPQPLSGTENASFPFWAPDSRSVAFFSGGKLKRGEISGGLPATICSAGEGRGGAWSQDGTIVFAPEFRTGLFRVPASGGDPAPLTRLDTEKHSSHRWPQVLPDGKHLLFLAINHDATKSENDAIYWAATDGSESRLLMHNFSNAVYASGFLLYARDDNLIAQRFDPAKGELQGDPKTIAGNVEYDQSTWHSSITASGTGILAYHGGGNTLGARPKWVDATGKEIGTIGDVDQYRNLRLSPDGKRLAVARGDPSDLWIYDLASGVGTRFTFSMGTNEFLPVWSPEGRRIAFTWDRSGQGAIYMKEASGAGGEELLQQSSEPQRVTDWSADGRYLLYEQGDPSKRIVELWAIPVSGDRKPFLIVNNQGRAGDGRFSPDGAWVAYDSDESGMSQVYVTRFVPPPLSSANPQPPAGRGKWQISTQGGIIPVWRRDGRELYFMAADNHVMAVPVRAHNETFEIGPHRPLFSANFPSIGIPYDVARDGKKFIVYAGQETASAPITLVVNWNANLKK